jgi:hypothetical protein
MDMIARQGGIRPTFTDGQLEALKWLALASMFLDHVGRHLLGWGQDTWVFAGGRLAFPLFAFVLGMNLAREGEQAQRSARVAGRLGLWAGISVFPSVLARGDPHVLNVLATLSLGAALCWTLASDRSLALRLAACIAIALASQHVEFGLAGVFLVAAVYVWRNDGQAGSAVLAAVLFLAVGWLNAFFGGVPALLGTLACVPIAWAVSRLPVQAPRLQLAFYLVYPLHLGLIGVLKALG